MSIAVTNKWSLLQIDVKHAFLNGLLKEIVFLEQPQEFVNLPRHVYHLKHALYGLKQAPRA